VADVDFELTDLDTFVIDGMNVPEIRQTTGEPAPKTRIKVGEQKYTYDRSVPIKGHSAHLPKYLREQMAAGKHPLLIERPDRLYVYFEG
jgi:hypothetical protein